MTSGYLYRAAANAPYELSFFDRVIDVVLVLLEPGEVNVGRWVDACDDTQLDYVLIRQQPAPPHRGNADDRNAAGRHAGRGGHARDEVGLHIVDVVVEVIIDTFLVLFCCC